MVKRGTSLFEGRSSTAPSDGGEGEADGVGLTSTLALAPAGVL